MAEACMPEEFFELARPMLPLEKESSPEGGRPPKSHRIVLKVIWFVLVTGCRWKDVPKEMGCCGETARTRLQSWEQSGIWDQLHQLLLTMLRQENKLHLETAIVDTTQVRAFGGGDATGPSPVDRRKKGTKYTRRCAAGDSRGRRQPERSLGDSARGGLLSRCGRQAGTSAHASQETVRRRGLRLRSDAKYSSLAGYRAAHSAPQ